MLVSELRGLVKCLLFLLTSGPDIGGQISATVRLQEY